MIFRKKQQVISVCLPQTPTESRLREARKQRSHAIKEVTDGIYHELRRIKHGASA